MHHIKEDVPDNANKIQVAEDRATHDAVPFLFSLDERCGLALGFILFDQFGELLDLRLCAMSWSCTGTLFILPESNTLFLL
jgi:predicted AAA+ superfamily ATPase